MQCVYQPHAYVDFSDDRVVLSKNNKCLLEFILLSKTKHTLKIAIKIFVTPYYLDISRYGT
jgi:hypothetical protein